MGLGMFRVIVIGLALMAAGKLASHAYLYRAATHDIIVSTYRDQAIRACARNGLQGPMRVPPQTWSASSQVSLAIGKRDIDVYLWQINHRLWEARFKNPYLVVTADLETAHIYCEYDVRRGFALVQQL